MSMEISAIERWKVLEVNGHVLISLSLVLHLLLFVPQSLIHNTEVCCLSFVVSGFQTDILVSDCH